MNTAGRRGPCRRAPDLWGATHAGISKGIPPITVDGGCIDQILQAIAHSGHHTVEFPTDRGLSYRAANSGAPQWRGALNFPVRIGSLADQPYLRLVSALTNLPCVLCIIFLILRIAGAWPVPEI